MTRHSAELTAHFGETPAKKDLLTTTQQLITKFGGSIKKLLVPSSLDGWMREGMSGIDYPAWLIDELPSSNTPTQEIDSREDGWSIWEEPEESDMWRSSCASSHHFGRKSHHIPGWMTEILENMALHG